MHLFNGRHCIVNAEAVEGTGLKEVCHLAEGADEFKKIIQNLYERPFTFPDLQLRREKLQHQYDNHQTASKAYSTDMVALSNTLPFSVRRVRAGNLLTTR